MEQVMLDMIPTGAKAVCHVSQYDIGRTIRFNLISGGAAYTLSGTETVKVYIKKPDGTTAERNIANTSSTYVDWVTGEGDCDQAGKCECELVITSGTTVIGSKNFTVKIEEDPYNEQGVVTETAGPAVIATFTTNVVDLLQEVKCEINAKQDLHGYDHPWTGGAGKNKLPLDANIIKNYNGGYSAWTNNAYTTNGITFKIIEDADNGVTKITASGTATADIVFRVCYGTPYLVINNSITVIIQNTSRGGLKYDGVWVDVLPTPLTIANVTNIEEFWVRISNGATLNNANITPMICLSTIVDYTYEPYSNICPIISIDELNISRTGVNLFDKDKLTIARSPYASMTFDKATYLKAGTYTASISNIDNATSWRFGFKFFDKSGNIITNAIANGYVSFVATKAFLDIYDNGNVCLQSDDTTGTSVKITLTSDIYIVACIGFGDTGGSTSLDYQIEQGSQASEYHAYNGNNIVIDLDGTRYGGQLIILPDRTYFHVTHQILEKTVASMNNDENFPGWRASGVRALVGAGLNTTYTNQVVNVGSEFSVNTNGSNDELYLRKSTYGLTQSQWISQYPNLTIQFCVEIATPFDIDLTPHQIEALLGVNNVWHDGNGNTEVKYLYNA